MRFLNERGNIHFSESLLLKAVSLLLALILWITILGLKREEQKFKVKLEPLLPPGVMVVNRIPAYIIFTLSGPRVSLKDVEKKIQPIRPDLRRSRVTTTEFNVNEDLLGELPPGVHVTSFFPPTILIRMEELTERYFPVRPTLRGSPALGFEVSTVKSFPSKVAVSGPKSSLDLLDSIGTEAFDISDLKGTKDAVVPLEIDTSQGLALSRDKLVRVRVLTHPVPNYEERKENPTTFERKN